MHVILHVGAHRTASSTFQTHLAGHRPLLRQAGCAYWGPKITRGGLFRRMMGGLDIVLPWEMNRAAKRVRLRAEGLQQDGVESLIVSDENMLGSLRTTLEDTMIYAGAGARIAGFASGFDRHRVTVAIGVRSYADWWTSALAYRLQRGGPLPKDRLRECMVTQPRRWRHVIEDIAKAAPDANLVVWSHEARGHDPAGILHDLAGVKTPAVTVAPANVRPDAAALQDYLSLCDINADDYNWRDGQFHPFAEHEVEALEAQYAQDLDWLAAGANGLADYIDTPTLAPLAKTLGRTDDGRGAGNDRRYQQMARSGPERAQGAVPG